MRIGLMGGTFDPIHLGHLRAAESAREELELAEVAFVPCGVPPHRSGPFSSALDRFTMVALATAAHPAFLASDLELRREGTSYTVDTVAALLEARRGASVVLIVGSDAFAELPTWKDPARLLALCRVAVVQRPGVAEAALAAPDAAQVLHVPGPALAVSATAIRERAREGRSVRYLVPNMVADYIAKRGLYR